MTETRKFQMHEKLLLDVIKRQAGSIEKAVLEGVMNSIEAGASKVDITLSLESVKIEDNGKGFRNRNEIEKWFETFGQPHEASEGKKWAQFRMGRGQLFAFGVNLWRTGKFRMKVDVNESLDYQLVDDLPDHKGCEVEVMLYSPVSERESHSIIRQIESFVKWVEIPVIVNGLQVNKSPSEVKWGKETNGEAFIKLNDSDRGLDVYNLGVFVRRYPKYQFGVSGTVVSKSRLDVNFARNDVINSCPVWKRIKAVVDSCEKVERIKTKTNLSPEERLNMIDRLNGGELTQKEAVKIKMFMDTNGHPWSVQDIMRARFLTYSVAPALDRRADRLLQSKTCLILDAENVDQFDCDPDKLFGSSWRFADGYQSASQYSFVWGKGKLPSFVDFEKAAKDIDKDCHELPEESWTPSEFAWVRIMEKMLPYMQPRNHHDMDWKEFNERWGSRRIVMGLSDTAGGWTDGRNFIAIARSFIRNKEFSQQHRPIIRNLGKVAALLLHEMVHGGQSLGADHGPDFYTTFHDLVVLDNVLADCVQGIVNWMDPGEIDRIKKMAQDRYRSAQKRAKTRDRKLVAAAPVVADKPKPKKPPTKKPKAKKAKGETADGLTASQLDNKTLKAIYDARHVVGMTWKAIESKYDLRPSSGMTAVHAVEKWERIKDKVS